MKIPEALLLEMTTITVCAPDAKRELEDIAERHKDQPYAANIHKVIPIMLGVRRPLSEFGEDDGPSRRIAGCGRSSWSTEPAL